MEGRDDDDREEMSLTLKYLLENPALLRPPENSDDEKCKDEDYMADYDQQKDLASAYLGPQIWNDMLLSDDLKLEPIDLDQLLDPVVGDDEVGDLNLMMSSSTKLPDFSNDLQAQQSNDDHSLVSYQDMPQLMSAHVPISAKQVRNPIDYFTINSNVETSQQPDISSFPSSFDSQLSHSSFRSQPARKRQIEQIYNYPPQEDFIRRNSDSGQMSFTGDTIPANQQHVFFSENLHSQQLASKRPRHSSLPIEPPQQHQRQMSHPHQLSPHQPMMSRQQSVQEEVLNQIQQMPPPQQVPQQQHSCSAANVCPTSTMSSPSTISPISPLQVHIPSPKHVDFIPSSADVIISTPQDCEEGSLFDPSQRIFTEDELKPQPIIRKSKKVHVPQDSKDGKYWTRRSKNNVAAKRSREARRIKENQIAMRANYLERENAALKSEICELRNELTRVVELLRKYEKRFPRLTS